MSLKVEQLRKLGSKVSGAKGVVLDQLRLIDDKISHSEKTWGRNIVICDLPTDIVIPGLEKRDSQRIIYSEIINSLQNRGFDVRIFICESRTRLFVAWTSDLSKDDEERMNKIIAKVRLKDQEEVNDFIDKKN